MAILRLIGSVGAGGVLYLTPIVFHLEAFSAGSITRGLALAALAGTGSRMISGLLLDRGTNCSVPVAASALLAMASDAVLFGARGFGGYLTGVLLLGIAMGFYWPAIELAVPLSCPPMRSARAFALVRSADALGIALGALLGALLSSIDRLRGIYVVDLVCLAAVLVLLLRSGPLPQGKRRPTTAPGRPAWTWLPPLLPMLAVAVLATAMPALMQSALPLDLVRGGLQRPALPESIGALLIGLQLGLLVLLQWPVGKALARRPVASGLALSLLCFAGGCVLLAASTLSRHGMLLVMAAQLPLALGEAAFLPTATEAVVELSPPDHQGLAMALFSQCFAVSSLGAPLMAGALLDGQGHGAGLWLLMAALVLLGLPLVRQLAQYQRRNLIKALSRGGGDGDGGGGGGGGGDGGGDGGQEILYRFESDRSDKPDR